MREDTFLARCALVIAVVVTAASLGCSKSAPTKLSSGADYRVIRAMSSVYDGYLRDHNGQPPKDEQAFREYLQSKGEDLAKEGLSVDIMFTSPRSDGTAIQWVYAKLSPKGPMGMSYCGYEKDPLDGKRLVIGTRGMYELMDDNKFQATFSKAKK
jgi:hypothetical protein